MMGRDGFISVRIQREGGKQDRRWPAGESEEESHRDKEKRRRAEIEKKKKKCQILGPEATYSCKKASKRESSRLM